MLPSTPHTVTLTTGITDEAGNALAQNFVSTFTTGTSGGGGTPGVYTTGSYSFSYTEIAFPPETGSFSVSGVALDPTGGFPASIDSVCGGSNISDPDTSIAFCYGAVKNPDGTADIAALVVTKTGSDITPGNYPVGLSPVALYIFAEGVENFELSPDFDPTSIESWLGAITADRTFLSVTGSITITTIDDTTFEGTFSGTMLAEAAIFTISNGTFSMSQL